MPKGDYKKLEVWNRAIGLSVLIYQATKKLESSEKYGLTSQMRRAAVSIPANIAEGYRQRTDKAFHQFLRIAYGSGAELETYMEICTRLELLGRYPLHGIHAELEVVMKMLNRFLEKTK